MPLPMSCPTSLSSAFPTFAALLLALSAHGRGQDPAAWSPRTVFEATADFSADPVPQIQTHLAAVIARLEARDVSDLSDAQRAERNRNIATLSDYAAAGRFPRNLESLVPTPVFIDDTGTACAVGHLMVESGARALAERVAACQNLAYVPQLAVPGVAEWVAASGLSLEECAWIQPTYGPCAFGSPPISVTMNCYPALPNSTSYIAELIACGTIAAPGTAFEAHIYNLPSNTTATC
jgi:hypothetical protein